MLLVYKRSYYFLWWMLLVSVSVFARPKPPANSVPGRLGSLQGNELAAIAGLPLNSLVFNGTNQYARVPFKQGMDFATGTIELWLRPDWVANSRTANPCLVAVRRGGFANSTRYSFHINNDLKAIGLFNGTTYKTVPFTFLTNKWYHVAFVMGTTNTKVYIDGTLIGSTGNVLNTATTGLDFKIGTAEDEGQGNLFKPELFYGAFDELRVWNVERTQSQIVDNKDTPISPAEANLHAYYPIDAGINCMDELKDYGPNKFTGKLGNYSPIITPSQTNVSCFGGNNGEAVASVRSGNAPYTYKWIGAQSTAETAAGLTAGVYSLTVTDMEGCTATQGYTITQPSSAVGGAGTVTNVSGFGGSNGAINLTPSGGTAPYTFIWNDDVTDEDRSGLAVGTYSVTITDASGCTSSKVFTITQPAELVAGVVSQTNVSGNGESDGSATVSVSGGVGPYSYSWAPSGGTNATATGLSAGVYTVTITDANGNVTTHTFIINQPPLLTANALVTEKLPIQVTASGCAGTVNWTVQGGTGVANGAIYTLSQPANYTLTARCMVGTDISTESTPLVVSIQPGDFAIASVNTVSCLLVNASRGEYSVKFTPVYSGLTGAPVSFSVINEKLPTDAVAPYTLRLYSDNPTITLVAEQAGSGETRFAYSWRAVCSGNTGENRPPVATNIPTQQLIVNQPYQLDLTAYFADPDGQTLSFYADGLPAGLSLTGGRISGTPSTTGVSQVTVTAIDPNSLQVSTVVSLNVNSAVSTPTPTPGTFAITGVTTVNCEVVSASERRVSLMPQYSGLNGQPVAFSVKNETAPTTLAGPHTVRLYTDNPVVTLLATQSGTTVSYQYSWLAACGTTTPTPTNLAPVVAIPLASQTATVGQGYSLYISRNTFSDPNGDALTLSVGDLPAGLSYSTSLSAITGTPAQAGESMITVVATDAGGLSASSSFILTVIAPTQPTPTPTPTPIPGTFAIAGVTTVNCEVVSASERRVIFLPLYSGVDGQPIAFAVKNEMASTTAPGPYALRLYTDNPTITLVAEQGGAVVSYRYEWLKGCNSNSRQGALEMVSPLQVTVLGNPVVGESAEVEIRGAEGQPVKLQVVDLMGNAVHQQSIRQATATERLSLPLGRSQGMLLLHVSTPAQQQQIKLIRP